MTHPNCVVSVSVGPERFMDGQERLQESLVESGHSGDWALWTDYPPDSPSQHESPYAFKCFAFKAAFDNGHDNVLWLDSTMVVLGPLDSIWDQVKAEGYLFLESRHPIMVSDQCLEVMGASRSEVKDVPSIVGGCMALSLKHDLAENFFDQWIRYAAEKRAFVGDWKNHRHDQAVASILALRLRMRKTPLTDLFAYNGELLTDKTIVHCMSIE